MGRYLLDTHTLIWAINDPDRLGEQALPVLRNRTNQILVSAASAWEMHTKARLGKLPGAEAWLSTLEHQIARLEASILPISWPHSRLAGSMDWEHRDPFDRMLAAQAMLESLTLITTDRAFSTLPGLRTLW
ncbi:PIN domain [Actinomyces bovis]|uniref:PIN domain n=1 Tax=Actinomyces bovis TaxID=1658 RepID=A0ABY1VPT6_9ACTO|nr:type II toxin-antitoxin system VapC family toxin [Actinomyces bovis]SPT53068.1 PIN domain [Actinomyces bovis]VEG52986.1 PIN domain [Actinomyces israelii]